MNVCLPFLTNSSSSGVMALQLSTLGQPRVFPPLSFVLSLVCCLCEWKTHHLAIVRNVISPALPRLSSVSVSMNTTIEGSVCPSKRLCSDYMFEVSKMTASDPAHNFSTECWADSWCLYFWCERFLTHQGLFGDSASPVLVAYSLVSLSASRFQSCRSKFLSPQSCIQAPLFLC